MLVTPFVLLSSPSLILTFLLALTSPAYQLFNSCLATALVLKTDKIHLDSQLHVKKITKNLDSQWESKQCFSDSECRTWGTGNFCCGDTCCDQLPEEEEYQDYYEYDYIDLQEPWMDLDLNASLYEVG